MGGKIFLSYFNVSHCDGRQRVCRRRGERYFADCVRERDHIVEGLQQYGEGVPVLLTIESLLLLTETS